LDSTAGVSDKPFDQSVFTGLKESENNTRILSNKRSINRRAGGSRTLQNNYYQVYVLRQKLVLAESNLLPLKSAILKDSLIMACKKELT
jgi:hypothetical protein